MGFYFVTTGWIFEIGLCVNSINKKKYTTVVNYCPNILTLFAVYQLS